MMQLSNYSEFPTNIPVIAEDEIFLYPFMISPLFLSDESNIAAANKAMDENTLVIVCSTQPGHEAKRDFDSLYKVGVIHVGRKKHHHIAALRLIQWQHLGSQHRQADPIGIFIDHNVVPNLQRWHHGG